MMIADLHIHSRYSRATSKEMTIPKLTEYAKLKGISMLGTGDFTHPAWLRELENYLEPKDGYYEYNGIKFILSVEVNNIYTRRGRLRRLHNIIFAPDFKTVHLINNFLGRYGKLEADGRPTLSLDTYDMLKGLLDISNDIFMVPAHIWTPWFSLFGSNSGFDSIEECLDDLKDKVFALETGLSSDPAMNWRLSALDNYTLISNSDAHSPSRLGREANVFKKELNYYELMDVLKNKNREIFLYTIEFYPQEGKYHFDGHRKCGVRLTPREARFNNNICPVCSRSITIGVMHRVESLGDREEGYIPPDAIPFKNLIPLEEIIAEAMGVGRDTVGVKNEYRRLCNLFGNEFEILLNTPIQELKANTQERIAIGIERARRGDVIINPGYDGVFGKVKIFEEEKPTQSQLGLF
ncbi:DNA helicase UvrD [candidate division WOR-3 bacterium 4484_100]|uniref:DNA helicase UvrD n=1 Tax=candidate division WOR-3 bacterium 4484_100 TaxID=1936077 RepID=A0A1V4QE85_UNCW3|nr:MAG: DNA helicase UvrD [candidate division WOR-3 bacterium 4484_100]